MQLKRPIVFWKEKSMKTCLKRVEERVSGQSVDKAWYALAPLGCAIAAKR